LRQSKDTAVIETYTELTEAEIAASSSRRPHAFTPRWAAFSLLVEVE